MISLRLDHIMVNIVVWRWAGESRTGAMARSASRGSGGQPFIGVRRLFVGSREQEIESVVRIDMKRLAEPDIFRDVDSAFGLFDLGHPRMGHVQPLCHRPHAESSGFPTGFEPPD